MIKKRSAWSKSKFFLHIIMRDYVSRIIESGINNSQLLIFSMKEVVEEVTRKKIPDYVQSIVLEVIANNKDDEDVEIPYIKFNLR